MTIDEIKERVYKMKIPEIYTLPSGTSLNFYSRPPSPWGQSKRVSDRRHWRALFESFVTSQIIIELFINYIISNFET